MEREPQQEQSEDNKKGDSELADLLKGKDDPDEMPILKEEKSLEDYFNIRKEDEPKRDPMNKDEEDTDGETVGRRY